MVVMQWLADEKVKHRVIGLAVLLSIAIVFIPAMVKKSNQRLDKKMNFSINMPDKPKFPEVAAEKPKAMFNEVKVAHVVIKEVDSKKNVLKVADVRSLSGELLAMQTSLPTIITKENTVIAKSNVLKEQQKIKQVIVSQSKPKAVVGVKQILTQVLAKKEKGLKSEIFSVQLAAFLQEQNAATLVQILKQKGYKASYDRRGKLYRVLVGTMNQREQAKNLQKDLNNKTQLSGFIVKTG